MEIRALSVGMVNLMQSGWTKADKKRSVLSSWVVVPAGQRDVLCLILNHGFSPSSSSRDEYAQCEK